MPTATKSSVRWAAGSLALVNNILARLKFAPAKNFAGSASLSFTTNDLLPKGAHTTRALIKIMVKH